MGSEIEIDISSPSSGRILAYPSTDASVVADRIRELEALGVHTIITGGRTLIGGTPVCGKGCVGLVVKVRMRPESGSAGAVCALKVRRTDADRKDMHDEERLHRVANAAGVGPRFRGCSDNFLLMDFIEGSSILEWSKGATSKTAARHIAESILVQCRQLDRAGIDHGQLSRLDRHVLIPTKSATKTGMPSPVIIDFESASTSRKTANVSAAAQALFIGGRQFIKRTISGRDRLGDLDSTRTKEAIAAIKAYKQDKTDGNFDRILDVLLGTSRARRHPASF